MPKEVQPPATLQERLDNVKRAEAFLKTAQALALEAFEEYIRDRSIPLDERWALWVDAPDGMKSNDPYIPDFLDGASFLIEDLGYYKHETIVTKDLVERVGADVWNMIPWTAEAVDELREHILAANIGRFELDW